LVPAAASTGLVVASIGGVLAALGILTAFAGVVTDPLQAAVGIHQRRLQGLLNALEAEFCGRGGDYRLRDAYVARVADVIDLLRSALYALK
jgi:hypothetical protein